MVEVLREGTGFKTECEKCGSILKFLYKDMNDLEESDRHYNYYYKYDRKVKYISCPICNNKVFTMIGDEWAKNTGRLYKDEENGPTPSV